MAENWERVWVWPLTDGGQDITVPVCLTCGTYPLIIDEKYRAEWEQLLAQSGGDEQVAIRSAVGALLHAAHKGWVRFDF